VAVTLLMAKASIAVLLSFMGKAPYFLFYAVLFDEPAIGLELNARIANVCCTPYGRITATRLREGARRPGDVATRFYFRC
jgi:hypothetical protein